MSAPPNPSREFVYRPQGALSDFHDSMMRMIRGLLRRWTGPGSNQLLDHVYAALAHADLPDKYRTECTAIVQFVGMERADLVALYPQLLNEFTRISAEVSAESSQDRWYELMNERHNLQVMRAVCRVIIPDDTERVEREMDFVLFESYYWS